MSEYFSTPKILYLNDPRIAPNCPYKIINSISEN